MNRWRWYGPGALLSSVREKPLSPGFTGQGSSDPGTNKPDMEPCLLPFCSVLLLSLSFLAEDA